MLEALDSIKKEIEDSGFLPDHMGPGWGPYTGRRKEIWAAYRRDVALAEGWAERLDAVIEAREPDAVATVGSLALLGHLHYALATKLFDSQPTDARGDSARAWGRELRSELNRLAPIYVGRFSEALELAHQAKDAETERLVSRRLYDIQEEIEGISSLLPEHAKQARALVSQFNSCEPWSASSKMDFVPENLVRAPDDPQKSFTLRQATEGLVGRGALVARLSTSLGEIRCSLFHQEAPYSVANFVGLARGLRSFKDPSTGNWAKRRAYDGVIFHRVIRGFMAQGGDPSGTGRGDPGFMIPNEQSPSLIFNRRGLLAGAHRGRDTGGMQFFITDAAAPHLNGGYTIFGLCDDKPVLDALMGVPIGKLDRPEQPPVIQSVTIAPEFSCETESATSPHRTSPEGALLKVPEGGGLRPSEIVLPRKPGTVRGPVGNATVAVLKVTGTVSEARMVVARMRAGFRRCFQRGLDRGHPDAGVLHLTIRIGESGQVTSVASETNSDVHSSVQTCVKARARAAQFRPPQEGQAEVVAQVTFAKK